MLNIPDARTLWAFKQRLAKGDLGGRAIFDAVSLQLQQHAYLPRGGQIVDASIVQAPITQCNSQEREALNAGQAPQGWSDKNLQCWRRPKTEPQGVRTISWTTWR